MLDPKITITKRVLIDEIHEYLESNRYPFKYRRVEEIVNDFIDYLSDEVVKGSVVYFTTVGRIYSIVKKEGRPVRNPKTGEPYTMEATVNFKFANGSCCQNKQQVERVKILKSTMIEWLTERFDNKERVATFVHSIFLDAIKLVRDENARIEIRGFGSFYSKVRLPRKGRNPKSGERVEVGEKIVVCYRAGKQVKARAKALRL